MKIEDIYPICRSFFETEAWKKLIDFPELKKNPEQFSEIIAGKIKNFPAPAFLPDLARIERALYQVKTQSDITQKEVKQLAVNPALVILELKWRNLPNFFNSDMSVSDINPEPGDEILLVWLGPNTGKKYIEAAESEDLLVLKMVIEGIPEEVVATSGNVPIGAVDQAIDRAVQKVY
jgi:hypothetical protein